MTKRSRVLAWFLPFVFLLLSFQAKGQLLMDVFGGWDGHSVAYRWTPLVIEISNHGMPLTGYIEIRDRSNLDKRISMMAIEIPSQSNKRVMMYVPPQASYNSLTVSLLSDREKVIKEQQVGLKNLLSPSRLVAESIPSAWPKMGLNNKDFFPKRPGWQSTRMLKQHLPDSFVGYDALTALHLGWSDVKDLSVQQKQALLDWVWLGGHLIVSAENIDDWRSDPWWKEILPFEVSDRQSNTTWSAVESWTRERCAHLGLNTEKITFQPLGSTESLVVIGSLKKGKALIQQDALPLIAIRRAGRGFITQMLFNPGLEPFRSWNGREDFWQCLLQLPQESMDEMIYGGGSKEDKADPRDSIREAARNAPNAPPSGYSQKPQLHSRAYDNLAINMLSTDQQQDFPWIILSTLLIGYVILIGPVDYIWLKRKKKWVWTWLTFPSYVAATTILIYFLGYWTNSGVSEWKQWTIQDWFSDSRWQYGTTVSRFYSSRNSEYAFRDAERVFSQVREVVANEYGSPTINRQSIILTPSGTRVIAEIPVWTSASFSGRFQTASNPIEASFDRLTKKLTVKNLTAATLENCRWVMDSHNYFSLGNIKAGEAKEWDLNAIQETKGSDEGIVGLIDYAGQYHYGGRRASPMDLDLSQQLFFLSRNKHHSPPIERGSVGDSLDLSCSWQDGDAVLLATSTEPTTFPWGLNFKPMRHEHTITHRFHFPAQLGEIASPNPDEP
jgi:hypothetical protein